MGAIFASTREVRPLSIDWRGPIVMFLCFLGAILCAVGHHALNLELQGRPVSAFSVDQQWISRTGNALAYIFKVLLVLATAPCKRKANEARPFRLHVWSIRQHPRVSASKVLVSTSVPVAGCAHCVVRLSFCYQFFTIRPPFHAQYRSVSTPTIPRLTPLVAIITPGTISVVSAPTSEPAIISVQQREYGKTSYDAAVQADNGTVFYGGARSYLKGPTLAMLAETEVLSVGTFPTNLTWSMGFFGPAISCSDAGAEVTAHLTNIILPYQQSNQTSLMYDTWIPRPAASPNYSLVDGTLVLDPDENSNLRILDQTSPDAARIYYSIAPDVTTQATMKNPIYIIQYALFNASWRLDVDVRNTGKQTLAPNLKFENWMPGWSSIKPPLTASTETNITLNYAGLMETFGAITSGHLDFPNDPKLPFTQTSLALETSPILFNDAFPDPFNDTAMIKLQRTFESLFQNMTLSARYAVLPRQDLRDDASDWSFVDVNATSTFSRNVYSYDSRDLIIAYSLAIVGSAMCILLAMLAVSDMGAVYSNSFSTAVRVSRSQSLLDTAIQDDHDRSGAQPLPMRIADAYIWVGREDTVGMGVGRGKVATAASLESTRERRSWWGKEQVVDLEKSPAPPSNGRIPPDIFVGEPKTSGPLGGWV